MERIKIFDRENGLIHVYVKRDIKIVNKRNQIISIVLWSLELFQYLFRSLRLNFIYLHKYMKMERIYLSLFLNIDVRMKQYLYKVKTKLIVHQNKMMRKHEQNKIAKGQKYKEAVFKKSNYQNSWYIYSALSDKRNRQEQLDNVDSRYSSRPDNSSNIKPDSRLLHGFKKYFQTNYRNKKGLVYQFFINSATLTNEKEDDGLPPKDESMGIHPRFYDNNFISITHLKP